MSVHNEQAVEAVKQALALGLTLDQIPAGRPPAGRQTNFLHHESRAYMITTTNVVCLVLVFIIVGMRIFTRIRIVKSFGYDDWGCLFALACWVSETALFQYAVRWGAGVHLWDLPINYIFPNLMQGWTICAVMYSVTMMFAKLSILLLYRRLFPIVNFKKQWYFVFVFTVGYSVAGILVSIFQCRPIESTWTLMVVPEYCIDTSAFYTSYAALNVASDIMILALPIPIVWGLQTTLRKKIVLTCLFLMGSISCIVSILRLRSVVILYATGFWDVTWGLVDVAIWSQAELTAVMICACLPTLRPFFERFTPVFFKSALASANKSSSNSNAGKYVRTGSNSKWTVNTAGATARTRADDDLLDDDIEMERGIKKEVQVGVHSIARTHSGSASQDSILGHRDNYNY